MSDMVDLFEDVSNPLDGVEEILSANDWVFERMTNDEITVHITGKMGDYTLFFQWQEEFSAMKFSCTFDMHLNDTARRMAATTLSEINAQLWLGHFDFPPGTSTPCFRHTTLFRGMTQTSGVEHIEDLVDIALSECERYYPVFELLAKGADQHGADMTLAMMPSAGQS